MRATRLTPQMRSAIVQAAIEDGVDPATALAYAERESSFDPRARNSVSIRGLYQMTGDLRSKYGVGDSDDPYTQTKGFNRLLADNRSHMQRIMGRDVSDAEAYAGHHFGAGRGAKMFGMDPNTDVREVFSRREMAINPHFARAGTVGNLLTSITGDIDRRRGTYGGAATAAEPLDFSQFGEAEDNSNITMASSKPAALDFSQYGEAA